MGPHFEMEQTMIETDNSYPVAFAEPRRSAKGHWLWLVPACPYCGRQHIHGAGDGPLPTGLGHRVSHCMKRDGDNVARGYELRTMKGTA